MKDIKIRAYALAAAFVVAGGIYQISGAAKGPTRTESWMQETALTSFGNYRTEGNLPGNVSYVMDPTTYKELEPFGIVARIMSDGTHSYDVTLIASSSKASFHDPRVCFTAQGWELSAEEEVPIETKTRGVVTATFARLKGKNGEQYGAFLYRGPEGFSPTTLGLKWQLFRSQLLRGQQAEGVFYRFIPQDRGTTKDQLIGFIRDYLDASTEPTHGYF